MNHDDITIALRMIAMGRVNAEQVLQLAHGLAVVLATPEERLAAIAQDEESAPQTPAAATPGTEPPPVVGSEAPPKRRGRPPKPKE